MSLVNHQHAPFRLLFSVFASDVAVGLWAREQSPRADGVATKARESIGTLLPGWRRGVVVSGVRHMNEVNPRLARLVYGWMTVFRRVYHLGMYLAK